MTHYKSLLIVVSAVTFLATFGAIWEGAVQPFEIIGDAEAASVVGGADCVDVGQYTCGEQDPLPHEDVTVHKIGLRGGG